MHRKLLIITALLLFAVGLQAQVGYGLKAGLNFPKISVSGSGMTVSTSALTSFYVGAYMDAPLASNFSFQPGLML